MRFFCKNLFVCTVWQKTKKCYKRVQYECKFQKLFTFDFTCGIIKKACMTLSTRLYARTTPFWVVLEKIMKQISARKIAITAMFIALLAVFAFTPIGLMPIIPGVIDTAFVLILLVTVAIQVEGLWVGLICSTAFGIFSFINSFIRPSLMAFAFQNPLISILPRVVIAFTTYFAMVGIKKLTKNNKSKYMRKHLPSLNRCRCHKHGSGAWLYHFGLWQHTCGRRFTNNHATHHGYNFGHQLSGRNRCKRYFCTNVVQRAYQICKKGITNYGSGF